MQTPNHQELLSTVHTGIKIGDFAGGNDHRPGGHEKRNTYHGSIDTVSWNSS